MKKFIDKDHKCNLVRGIEYYAVGLIVEEHTAGGDGGPSGKDYAVEYIDPFGNYQCEWRSADEIVISDISKDDYAYLKMCYERSAG